jgi:hypothetical protein
MLAGWNLVDVVHNGAALYRGKYSVAGDVITFTNVEEKWIAYDDRTTSYDWKTSGNFNASYECNEKGLSRMDIWATSFWLYPVK